MIFDKIWKPMHFSAFQASTLPLYTMFTLNQFLLHSLIHDQNLTFFLSLDPFNSDDPFKSDPFKSVSFAEDPFAGDPFQVWIEILKYQNIWIFYLSSHI